MNLIFTTSNDIVIYGTTEPAAPYFADGEEPDTFFASRHNYIVFTYPKEWTDGYDVDEFHVTLELIPPAAEQTFVLRSLSHTLRDGSWGAVFDISDVVELLAVDNVADMMSGDTSNLITINYFIEVIDYGGEFSNIYVCRGRNAVELSRTLPGLAAVVPEVHLPSVVYVLTNGLFVPHLFFANSQYVGAFPFAELRAGGAVNIGEQMTRAIGVEDCEQWAWLRCDCVWRTPYGVTEQNWLAFGVKVVSIEYSQKTTEYMTVGVDGVAASNAGGDETYTLEIPQLNAYDYAYYTAMLMHVGSVRLYGVDGAGVEYIMSGNKWQVQTSGRRVGVSGLRFKVKRATRVTEL